MYSKRAGTSGIRGQLYGTKLISLLYFRAIHDDDIEEFQLASNIDNIGAFDDICFKAKVKGFDKPVAVFIQVKHRENEKQTLKNDLAIYFDSYMKIRKSFGTNNNDLLFNGTFEETECLFVIYTTAKDDLSNDAVTSAFSSKLDSLIYTCDKDEARDQPGGTRATAMQPGGTRGTDMEPVGTRRTAVLSHKQEENVEFLCKIAMKEQIISLAEWVAYFTYDEENFQTMLSNELLLLYHVILAQKVFEVSEIQPNGHRIATFRNEFFDTNEEYLILFKHTLFKEILKKRKMKPTVITNFLSEFLAEPTDITKLSKLIGTVIIYNNGQLDIDKQFKNEFKPELCRFVSRSTVNEAVELAAKEILLSRDLKVPAAFGNKDLTISGSDEEIETTLDHITSRIIDLLDNCKSSDMVIVDESIRDGFLQLNASITGVIGNIFVLDDNTKLMKITDKWESLGCLAKRMYKKLIEKNHNLHDYKFSFKVDKLPKLSFNCSENEENLARDFLKRLLFYGKQADENGVEMSLKVEIEEYQRDNPNYFQIKTDTIFLKYHDKIQKWWMHPKQAIYLTRDCDFFKTAINNIIEDSLMCSINVTYMIKIKQFNYTFTEDAVKSLNLQDRSNTVVITENSLLTVVKVMQHLKNIHHVVLDLEYIIKLPTNDRNALRTELANSNENIFLIFVCSNIRNSRNEKRLLENISNAVHDKKTIVITNNIKSLEMLQKHFPKADNIVHDEKSSLIDMSEESQKRILENARVMFQGTEVRLDSIVNEKSKAYVKGDVLNKIISEETIVVGKPIVNRNYDEIKHMYVDRRLNKKGDDVNVYFKTLIEGEDDVVLVTAESGMGKSTLLTHLSLKTKEEYPEVWIVRINLLEYSKEFSKWKEDNTAIDTLETLKFMCQVVLREKLGSEQNNVEIALEEENGVVYLKHCSGDHWTEFELKLFLHFYFKGKLIFLFDGFDEICPHYMNEVIKCLKTVSSDPRKHRMWVTSRSYNEVKTILQREFSSSYEIENFSYMEMHKYLEIFWEYNLRLEELNSAQLENVKNFIEYMSKLKEVKLHGFVMQLHAVYTNAAHYLLSEIKYRRIPQWTYNINYDDSFYSQIKDHDYMSSFQKQNRDGNPLHLLLAAVFVESNIKSVKNHTRWNLEVNTYTFYERFLEMKMKTIQEKSKINIYNPDIIITYDKEVAHFISKHKKLAAYAIFKEHSHRLFSMKDLDEIKETITLIEKGGEKTGLICSVANEYSIFILTEYLAVEYVCDCLKSENDSDKLISWMDFIFNVMFSMESCKNIRNIFDYKIKTDKTLLNILEKKKAEIFNLIMEQGRLYSEYIVNKCKSYPVDVNIGRRYWALSDALQQQLHHFLLFFVKILKLYINKSNLNDFLDIVKGSQLLLSSYTHKSDVLIIFVFDVVRKIDETKFTSVLQDNFLFLPHSAMSSYVELSSLDIVERIFLYEDCVEPQQVSEPTSSGFSSGPFTSSKPSRPSTSSLPSRTSTSSLPSRTSTSSLPSRTSTSSLPSRTSTSSLPSRTSTSSLPSRTSTSSLPL